MIRHIWSWDGPIGDRAWEGAGRVTRADKARAYTVARGELVEAIAAVEIAHESGDARGEAVSRVLSLGTALYARAHTWPRRSSEPLMSMHAEAAARDQGHGARCAM